MGLKSYFIGPLEEGQQNNIEPFYLPEEAYFNLEDMYIWRGRLRKRFGSSLIGTNDLSSRLRINIGTTAAGSGNLGATVVPGTIFKIGQIFSIGTTVFTVNALGNPATLLTTGTATGTYDTTTGTVIITGNTENPSTIVYFYPAEPVMGLRTRETSNINAENLIAFDTQFAYEKIAAGWSRIGTGRWTATNSDFFWSSNYRGVNSFATNFYVVNGKAFDTGTNTLDGIKFIPEGSSTWTNLRPQLNAGANRFLVGAKIIFPFKDRLVVLHTIENETGTDRTHINRCRFSQNGNPTVIATSWRDDVAGRGGYIDAPTAEQIISAEFIKDRLLVYFERSTWELVYTGTTALPFRWQQINNELGCESSFSVVGFDTSVLGVGNVGVHTCNGVNVNRIDEKIPDEVFKIHNGNNGPSRVYGIRDFYNEMVYWSFPDATDDPTFSTRILAYNYRNNTWAFFNDSFTCFGYYQKDSDLTWATVGEVFPTWAEWNEPWGSPLYQSAFPFIVAGNQEGFVFLLNNGLSSNAQSLSITDMTAATSTLVVVDHNLKAGDYILAEDCQGVTDLNDIIFQVQSVIDANTIVSDTIFTGSYTGGGKLSRISNLNILSKQFNPGTPIGQQFRIAYIDFLLNRTSVGEISLNYLINTASGDAIQDAVAVTTLLGSNVLYTKEEDNQTFEINQTQIWHRYYIQTQAQFLQLQFFMSDTQMRDKNIAQSNIELHAMIFYLAPEGRITGL